MTDSPEKLELSPQQLYLQWKGSRMKFLTLLICFVSLGATAAESVQVNLGTVKLNGLFQIWALNDTTAANDAASNFRMRRTEIKLSGSVYPQTRWFVMFDPAKSLSTGAISASNDNKILQDLGVAFMPLDGLEIVIGQFKIPTTAEGLISSGELLLPERSYIGRTFGDRREPGLMIDYNPKPIRLRAMVSNGQVTPATGTGTNLTETNGSKDVNGRADFAVTEGLTIGAFASQSHATVGLSNRYGGDIQFTDGRLVARASGVQAKELDVDKNGMSVEAGYMLADKWQATGRYENFQLTSAPENSSSIYTLGANYLLEGHNAKIQLAHSTIHNFLGSNGTPAPTTNRDGGLTVLNVQMAF